MPARTVADRLDEAVDGVLSRAPRERDADLGSLLRTAELLRDALPPIPAGAAFRGRLAAQLGEPNPVLRIAGRAGDIARRGLHDRGRLIAAGAVSSAAVGMTVTAVALWLTARRHAGGQRAAHRGGG
jgi:hypothetical protein